MVRGGRAASKKRRRDERLAPVRALFGAHQPAQAPTVGDLPQRQSTVRQREIADPARFSRVDGAGQTAHRALQPLSLGRMIAAAQRLNDAAENPAPQRAAQPRESCMIDGDIAGFADFQSLDTGVGQAGFSTVAELARLTETPTPHIDAVYALVKLLAKSMVENGNSRLRMQPA